MTALIFLELLLTVCVAGSAVGALWFLRRKELNRWLGTYVSSPSRRQDPDADDDVHVLLCVADHYEPRWGEPTAEVADARVRNWVENYPRLFSRFRDADGRPPQHTFFFPIDQYDAGHLDAVAGLCRQGFGEVEVHLHHDNDTAESLRRRLLEFKRLFAERHGVLGRRRDTGEVVYGFIHGDWALDNSLPGGRMCGVNNELDVLRETGCYADFTLPSAPSAAQTRKINSIYYAVDDPARPKSHDTGWDVGIRPAPPDSLMLIQGPLLLNWRDRTHGLMPRIENACLQHNQPPSMRRLDLWLRARVQVPTRPDWFFVKLHTHGGPEANQAILLGEPMVSFHEELAGRAKRDARFHFHYVTAREMYNLARAAEAGWRGSVEEARDWELAPAARAGTSPAGPGVAPAMSG